MLKGQPFNLNDYIPAKDISVQTVSLAIEEGFQDVDALDLYVNDRHIILPSVENLGNLRTILERKKEKTSPLPQGIDYLAAAMAKLGGCTVKGAAITAVTNTGPSASVLLTLPNADIDYLIPIELTHSIGLAIIEDKKVFLKRPIYEIYATKKKEDKYDFGMYI